MLRHDERDALFDVIEKLKTALRREFGAEGFNTAWNKGAAAGQTVAHLHVHLLPRKPGDAGVSSAEPRSFLYRPGSRAATPQDELIAIAEKVRNALGG